MRSLPEPFSPTPLSSVFETRYSCFPGEAGLWMCFGNTEFCKPNLLQLNSVTWCILTSKLQLKFNRGVLRMLRMRRKQMCLRSVQTLAYTDQFGVLSETRKGEPAEDGVLILHWEDDAKLLLTRRPQDWEPGLVDYCAVLGRSRAWTMLGDRHDAHGARQYWGKCCAVGQGMGESCRAFCCWPGTVRAL